MKFFAGFGIYNILHMLLSGLILMGVIMQSLVMGYVMPAAQCDLHLSLPQRGWLAAIPFLGKVLHMHQPDRSFKIFAICTLLRSQYDPALYRAF